MSSPLVSIVMPTFNGRDTLPDVLDAISRQDVDFDFEVIAVDSSSHDGTADLLRQRVDQVISIPLDRFDHGLTRNLGIEHARGELIVLLVQDAVPATSSWLASLVAPLRADARVAGAYARQRPRDDASAITRHYLERWAGASASPRVTELGGVAELEAMAPAARVERCTFDNVSSCVRRTVWAQHPFRATPIGEDLAWAREVLLAGYRLVFTPAAEVIHSHDRTARYEFARTYALHRRLYDLFSLQTIPTIPLLARAIASSLALHWRCQTRGTGRRLSYSRAFALAFAWPAGQYLGARSAMKHRTPLRLHRV